MTYTAKTRLFLLVLVGLDFFACKEPTQPPAMTNDVRVELVIASKDAKSASTLETVVPIIKKLHGNVEFTVHYAGRIDGDTIESPHGAAETQGNIAQLCVQNHAPFSKWLSFMKCQGTNYRKIPDNWRTCMKDASQKLIRAIDTCIDGPEGTASLKQSVTTIQRRDVDAIPLVLVNGTPVTNIRSKDDYARHICRAFDAPAPSYCDTIPDILEVPVSVVVDKRCPTRTCNSKRFLKYLTSNIEGVQIETVDYETSQGMALFKAGGTHYLPIAIFDQAIEKDKTTFPQLKRRLVELKDGRYLYPLGKNGRPVWNPEAEICDDGIDNTGNDQVDCEDDDCQWFPDCRDEIPNHIELFTMSHCPYGIRSLDAALELVEGFDRDPLLVVFTLQFLGDIHHGTASSRHGPGEVEESKRHLCAQKYYPENYAFLDFVKCRNDAFRNINGPEEPEAWKTCAQTPFMADIIERCSQSNDGEMLLQESILRAQALQFHASPSWLINNRWSIRARSRNKLQTLFCRYNPDNEHCIASQSTSR